jgi:xanthine dehydrogenase accessory factor
VLVVGCGHVGRAVAELAHWLGFRVVAVDSRAEMVTEELLPGADLRLAGPAEDVLGKVPVTAGTYAVVTTSSARADVVALALLLATPVRSVQVIGGRRRWQVTRSELAARGVPEEALDRVRTPAGLDLGAETPREIALAILGQIVAARRRAGRESPS